MSNEPSNEAPPPTAPPKWPKPTDADRETLRARVKSAAKGLGLSGREIERRAGRPAGYLSKLYVGRVRLTRPLLDELAKVLKVEAPTLVQDTAFAAVLSQSEPVKSAEVLRLEKRVDELTLAAEASRTASAESDSLRRAAEERADHLERELQRARKDASAAKERVTAAELRALSLSLEREKLIAGQKDNKREGDAAKATIAALSARAKALQASLDEWRTYAEERAARAKQLEAYLTEQAANTGGGNLLGALALFGLGAAVGASSAADNSPRERAVQRVRVQREEAAKRTELAKAHLIDVANLKARKATIPTVSQVVSRAPANCPVPSKAGRK